MRLIPKNWSEFQQYKDRKPQWIKLHRDLLNDFSYSSVHINTKATLPLLWLLACEYEDGIIDASIDEIAFRIHIDKKIVKSAIDELLEAKFFSTDEECTEVYKSVPREEKRRDREETEKETYICAVVVSDNIPYSEIIDHLNFTAKTNFRSSSEKTKSLIRARWNDGFRVDDFKQVHIVKTAEWGLDEKFSKFIRPETLYSNKFEGYLNQKLSDSDKSKIVQQHTGMSASEIHAMRIAEAQREWELQHGIANA